MNINIVKKEIEANIGKKVQVVLHGMRNKKNTYYGTIKCAYPNIFSIQTETSEKSFSYADMCIGDLKIKYLS